MCWKRGEGEGVRGVERGSQEAESRSQEAPVGRRFRRGLALWFKKVVSKLVVSYRLAVS